MNNGRDGSTAEDFHKICDGKTDTVVFALSDKNKHIVGGYANKPHQTPEAEDGKSLEDPNAFIFSLDRKEKLEIKKPEEALFCHPKNCAGFGEDLRICINDAGELKGHTTLGMAYVRP